MGLKTSWRLCAVCLDLFVLCKDSTFAEHARRILVPGSATMLLQGGLESLDKAVPVERLGQVGNRPGFKCLRTNPFVGEGCEENERHAVPLGEQSCVQLDAAHAGHLDICDHTREVIEVAGPQELFGGCECVYGVSERPHQAVGRGAHRCIIVNDCDLRMF
jgi:hypothetical protein